MSASLLKHALHSHPASPAPPGLRVAVQRLAPDDPRRPLRLCFELLGDLAALRLPATLPPDGPRRTDGLWQHTCFEAFIAAPAAAAASAPAAAGEGGGDAGAGLAPSPYVEFNLAPSGAWAAYRFDGYRAGMRPEPLAVEPRVIARLAAGQLSVDVALAWPTPLPVVVAPPSSRMPGLPASAASTGAEGGSPPWHGRLGLTAVIEAADGKLSYWALRHPAARADFHNDGGFALGIEVPQ